MAFEVVALPVVKAVIGGVVNRIIGRENQPFGPTLGASLGEYVAGVVRDRSPAGGGGPSIPDRMPPPSASPWWAMAAPVIAFPTKKQRGKRKRAKKVARARTQAEQLLKQAQELAKKNPRLAKVLGRYGKYGRAGAWAFGPLVAWDLGQWVGGQIYNRGTDWYYGQSSSGSSSPGRMPKPESIKGPVRIKRGRIRVTRDQFDGVWLPKERPSGPAVPTSPRRGTSAVPAQTPKADPATSAQSQAAPQPAAPAAKAPSPRPGTSPWSAPRPSTPPARARSPLSRALPYVAAIPYLLSSRYSPPMTGPYSVPSVGTVQLPSPIGNPLTALNPYSARSCPPCKKERKKRKDGKEPCRNPVTSRRSKMRDGSKYITVTRRIECPA